METEDIQFDREMMRFDMKGMKENDFGIKIVVRLSEIWGKFKKLDFQWTEVIDFIAPFFILFAHIAIYMMIRRQRRPAR